VIETQQRFSKKAIKKAVMKDSLQSPIAVYPGVLAVLGGIAIGAFGLTLTTVAIAAVGGLIALSGWLFEYLAKHDQYSLLYLKKMHDELQKQREHKLVEIRAELESVEAANAISQLNLFSDKFQNFKEILERKFSPNELTYSRYLGIAEQVFLAGLDNLDNHFLTLKSISTVDVKRLEERLDDLRDEGSPSEISALEKRLSIYESQLNRVTDITMQNEIALTELDNVSIKLANVQTQKGMADIDMDLAMEELARMAHRADKYKHS
jgi:hypothetical protein